MYIMWIAYDQWVSVVITHKPFNLQLLLYTFSCRSFMVKGHGVGMIEILGTLGGEWHPGYALYVK